MHRIKFVSLSLILGIAFSISLSAFSHSADEGTTTRQGNIVCLFPDESGSVKPVIATEPCDDFPPHPHVLVTKTAVYIIVNYEDGLMKITQSSNRTDVQIAGKLQGSEQTGWVLFVD